ncbi:MAG: hypothetical protein SCALA702_21890 [Melioribacteraceae bacterium]|nr:MAG: hypothetical protein SCALA702_21890 [Melioribacteraceae bacterium]
MNYRNLLLMVSIFCGVTSAQVEFEFSGYVTEMPIYQKMDENLALTYGIKDDIFMNLNRLRLRPVLYLSDDTRINAEYEIAGLYFSNMGSFDLTSSGKTERQIVNLSASPVQENKYRVNHFIDRLYIKQRFDFGNIVVGRQRIQWGSGRIWNPTDLFNPINPVNFFKIEKDGADAVSVNYYIGSFTDLNVVFNPNELIAKSNYGARFRTNYGEYDFAVIGGYFDRQPVAGLDVTGNLVGAGVRFEGIIAGKSDYNEEYISFIAGIDNQFTAELYTLIEYHYNGEGTNNIADYDIAKLASGGLLNLNTDYIHLSSTYQYNPLINFGLSWMKNINDGSGFVGLSGNYDLIVNLTARAGAQISFGSMDTEYILYGSSWYLQFDYYF